ncbi:protein kinase [Yoonia sp. SS1-5]|uniref:Serine/threonine protein kinase n=1 Tax=Yoonia rhodophyticola TaxID=3137370 RepID=A0AAN0MBC1_9RHOB
MMSNQQNLPDDTDIAMTEALPAGTLLQGDQFTIQSKLGNGGFGITYLARDNYLDRNVVIKECFPEVFCHRNGSSVLVRSVTNHEKYRSVVEMFMREARSIAKLRHPNIVGVHRVFEDNDTAYITLDLIDGQNVLDLLYEDPRRFTPAVVMDIMAKLLDAVKLVHAQDLLHRDISPDNILLDKWNNPVLIDFGAAREEASRETRALSAVLVVKDGYSPQEFYFAGGKQNCSSDLYALGATFYHMITGDAPPNSQTRMAEVAGGGDDPCVPLVGRVKGYPKAFLQAIDKAMCVLPKDRVQTVDEWLAMIDPDAPQVAAVKTKKPKMDEKLVRSLTRLVSETNQQLTASSSPVRAPEPAVVEKPKRRMPDWIKEFNAETSEILNNEDEPATPSEPLVLDAQHVVSEPLVLSPEMKSEPLVLVQPAVDEKEPQQAIPTVEERVAETLALMPEPRKRKINTSRIIAAGLLIVSSVVVAHAEPDLLVTVKDVFR